MTNIINIENSCLNSPLHVPLEFWVSRKDSWYLYPCRRTWRFYWRYWAYVQLVVPVSGIYTGSDHIHCYQDTGANPGKVLLLHSPGTTYLSPHRTVDLVKDSINRNKLNFVKAFILENEAHPNVLKSTSKHKNAKCNFF